MHFMAFWSLLGNLKSLSWVVNRVPYYRNTYCKCVCLCEVDAERTGKGELNNGLFESLGCTVQGFIRVGRAVDGFMGLISGVSCVRTEGYMSFSCTCIIETRPQLAQGHSEYIVNIFRKWW